MNSATPGFPSLLDSGDNSSKTASTEGEPHFPSRPHRKVVDDQLMQESVTRTDTNFFKRPLEETLLPTVLKKRKIVPLVLVGQPPHKTPSNFQPVENTLEKSVEQEKPPTAKIHQGPSLREKFGHLLPDHMRLKIGYMHSRLLQKMCCIDRCINFIVECRNGLNPSFDDVVKNVSLSMKMSITLVDLQQIAFLNVNHYQLSWKQKSDSNGYYLCIRLPVGQKEHYRKSQLRRCITSFLMDKYTEHLKSRSVSSFGQVKEWDHGFDVESVSIPLGVIPLHPLQRKIALKYLDKSEIAQITNHDLKQVIEDTITLSTKPQDNPREKSPNSAQTFKNRLYEIIRDKQKTLQQKKRLVSAPLPADQTHQLQKFCQQACSLFISRRVCTMFTVSFLQAMRSRMSQSLNLPQLQCMLERVLGSKTGFLGKVSSPKGGMVQIQKDKYNQILKGLSSL